MIFIYEDEEMFLKKKDVDACNLLVDVVDKDMTIDVIYQI
jgi:hypothetical protein